MKLSSQNAEDQTQRNQQWQRQLIEGRMNRRDRDRRGPDQKNLKRRGKTENPSKIGNREEAEQEQRMRGLNQRRRRLSEAEAESESESERE